MSETGKTVSAIVTTTASAAADKAQALSMRKTNVVLSLKRNQTEHPALDAEVAAQEDTSVINLLLTTLLKRDLLILAY